MAVKFVIGLGASAGGLEALERFFDNCPVNSGGAFVVVMHLSRDFKSMLDELLARHTIMPVLPAMDGTVLQRNTVYIIQRATILEVDNGKFRVTTRPSVDPTGLATTIDTLFTSLARDWKDRAAGVVLSGSGSDGTAGVKAISEAGGFACAQTPETARFDSMPVSAISSHAISAVESPEALAKAAIEGVLLPRIEQTEPVVSEQESAFARILNAILGASNLDASKYKHSTFERRVRRRMMDLHENDLGEYADLIEKDPNEARTLKDTLLIGVTDFFRDEEAFETVEQQVIPQLIRRAQSSNEPIRIWTPGCATGEEAYSLGILFKKAFEDIPHKVEFQIFATDIKRQHLTAAARGEYPVERVKHIPDAMLDRYFEKSKDGSTYTVSSDLRKSIVFAPHDILSDPPFTRLDMVSCRNLLIYFSMQAQQKILSGFSFGLKENGFLFLGASETVGGHRDTFEFVDAKNRVFKKVAANKPRLERTPAVTRQMPALSSMVSRRASVRVRESALIPAYAQLLKDFAPACLMVSSSRELLHSFGAARNFLRPPDGVAHFDATEMVDDALKTPMIAGIERVFRDNTPITFSRIKLSEFPEPDMLVDLEVRPMSSDKNTENDEPVETVLVFIKTPNQPVDADQASGKVLDASTLVNDRVVELEEELERTRAALQSTIEQIETTNEELQAANEELMSSNEELQSTNEELSSVNEELYSVNSEYHRQNDELTSLNAHFDALLQSTEIAVVFVDSDKKLTRFTSLAGTLFGLQEADIGRPISLFRSPFENVDPAAVFAEANNNDGTLEVEAIDKDGHTWLLRVVTDTSSQGQVLTAINISALKVAQQAALKSANFAHSLQKQTRSIYFEVESKSHKIVEEFGAFRFWGQEDRNLPHKSDWSFIHPDDKERFEKVIAYPPERQEFDEVMRVWNAEFERYLHIETIGQLDTSEKLDRWIITGVNVDRSVEGRMEAIERSEILQSVLLASPSLIAYVDTEERYLFVNDHYEAQWDMPAEEIVGKTVAELLPPELYDLAKPHITEVLKGNRREFSATNELADGTKQELEVTYEPVRGVDNDITGFTVASIDITRYREMADTATSSESLVVSALQKSDLAVLLADVESTTIEFANPAALARMGFLQNQPLKPGTSLSKLTPEWGDKTWKRMLKNLTPGMPTLRRDVATFSSELESSLADIDILVVPSERGEKAFIQLIDTSERADAIFDLRNRSRQLAISNRDLEQFASAVAHDLRAPLRHISHFATFLAEELSDTQSDDIKEYIDYIEGSATTMSSMIESLLDYSRLGRIEREFKKVSLSECIKDARNLLQAEIKASDCQVSVGRLPQPMGDKDLLIRLFQNLLENSIKYCREGVSPKINISGKREEGDIIITVSDNGIGIDPNLNERIFSLFSRMHDDSKYSGLGVGLATCRRICELHNGKISCEPKRGNGTKFVITFPSPL